MLENKDEEEKQEEPKAAPNPLPRSPDQPLIDRSYDYKMDNRVEFQKGPSPKSVLHKILTVVGVVVVLCIVSKIIF